MTAQSKVVLLDGGMGQEIVNRGGKVAYGEWAVAALYENPDMVQAIHSDYIQAGADVITTNTYSTTRTRLKHIGMEDRFEELVQLAGELAVQACAAGGRHIRIAASLPPLEASYVAEFALSFAEMVTQYRELMDLLDPYVDIYLGETLSTGREARAVLMAAQNRDKPVWAAWTLQDHGSSTLRGGESLQAALAGLSEFAPDAILINCCAPDSIYSALPALRSSGLPFGGYANGFVEIPDEWASRGGVTQLKTRTDLSPDAYARQVQDWLAAGAAIVGGCCEVGPAHIARLRQLLDQTQESSEWQAKEP